MRYVECYDRSIAAQQVPSQNHDRKPERSQVRVLACLAFAGMLSGFLIFRHYMPWNDGFVHPLVFFLYVGPLALSISLGAMAGGFTWLLSLLLVKGWDLRRETASPNDVRNALLAIVAVCVVGYLMLTCLDSKAPAPIERPTSQQPSEAPQPDDRGGLGELRSKPGADYTVAPGDGAPRH